MTENIQLDTSGEQAVQVSSEDVQAVADTIAAEKQNSDRPSWLPEKFTTPEDMAKAYSELESKLGQPTEDAPVTEDNSSENNSTEDEAPISPETFQKFSQEFEADGKLSDKSYEELSKLGLSKEFVDIYIEGKKAQASAVDNQIFEIAGGKEQLQEMLDWAGKNYSDTQYESFNQTFQDGDPSSMAKEAELLKARFKEANGFTGTKLTGTSTNSAGVEGYASHSEMVADQAKPEYKTNPAFRDKVMKRAALSSF